jgi:hypothetical protein
VSVQDQATGITVRVKGYTHRREYPLSDTAVATEDVLIADQILRNTAGTIDVTLVDVPAGKYKLVTYHNEGAGHCGNCFPVKVSAGSQEATEFVRSGNHMTLEESMKVRAHALNVNVCNLTRGGTPIDGKCAHEWLRLERRLANLLSAISPKHGCDVCGLPPCGSVGNAFATRFSAWILLTVSSAPDHQITECQKGDCQNCAWIVGY